MKINMLRCKPIETAMEVNNKVEVLSNSLEVEKGRYQRSVGKLIYLFYTILDIAFLVSVVSQFMNNPNEEYQEAVYQILRYLKKIPRKGLFS